MELIDDTVYLVFTHEDYAGDTIHGIFSTYELAKEYVAECDAKCGDSGLEIDKVVLNSKIINCFRSL